MDDNLLYASKAEQIRQLYNIYDQKIIKKNEYRERLSSLLVSSYIPTDSGVSEKEEVSRLEWLVSVRLIKRSDFKEQCNKIKRTSVFGYEAPVQAPPELKEKLGYVLPIVGIIIGILTVVWWDKGVIILIASVVGLSFCVDHNKKVEVENAKILAQYRR
jgi:hypothetical protein